MWPVVFSLIIAGLDATVRHSSIPVLPQSRSGIASKIACMFSIGDQIAISYASTIRASFLQVSDSDRIGLLLQLCLTSRYPMR